MHYLLKLIYIVDLGPFAVFLKLYTSTSANNSILASVQYIFIQKILHQHQPLSWCAAVVSQTLHLAWLVNSMVADGLATQGVKASAALVLN